MLAGDPRVAAQIGRCRSQLRGLLAGAGCLALGACMVSPEPLSMQQMHAEVEADLRAAFAEQEPVRAPVTLSEAMARAVLYNLDRRVKIKEQALAQAQLDLSRYDMLPQVVASAGLIGRSNTSASSSRSVTTGLQSLETSTSLDDDRRVADLTFAWNVLDFGVSYFGAKQQADRTLIANERRRKVVQEIVQDVRATYWRAVAAERLIARIDPVMTRVRSALDRAAAEEHRRVRAPLESLTYQRELLNTLRQLEDLRSGLTVAKTELAALMNLALDQDFEVALPDEPAGAPLQPGWTAADLGRIALANRPELYDQTYQTRIAADEVDKAMLRLLPGIELQTSLNYDSNDFLLNNNWAGYSAKVTWNLLNLVSGPTNIRRAESEVEVAKARRQALSVAVLSQAYIALAVFEDAEGQYQRSVKMADLEERIRRQIADSHRAGQLGELAVIQAEVNALVGSLREDLALARRQNAIGQLFVAIGADPLPDSLAADDLQTVASALGDRQQAWLRGDLTTLIPPSSAPTDAATTSSSAPDPGVVPGPTDAPATQP